MPRRSPHRSETSASEADIRTPGGDLGADQSATTPVQRARDLVGNDFVTTAFFDGASEGPHGVLAAEMAVASEAVQLDSAFESNSAMLRAMRRLEGNPLDPRSSSDVMRLIEASYGAPIPEAVANRMSSVLGHDVSHARIHVDAAAAKAAELLGAHAFTLGADVYFGQGEWAPGTDDGDALLVHELTHVKQSDEGRLHGSNDGVEVSSPSDPSEREAYAAEATATDDLAAFDAGEDLGPIDDATPAATEGPILREGTTDPPPATPPADPAQGAQEAATTPKITVENEWDVGGDKARTTVGVKEVTFFQVAEDGAVWSASSGSGKTEADGTYKWTAPDAAGSATITAKVGSNTATQTMDVKEPTGIKGDNPTDMTFPAGTQGAGMNLDLILTPETVSFSAIYWNEVAGPPSNESGYFTKNKPGQHSPAAPSKPGVGNVIKDKASFKGWGKPWEAGSYDWVIPNHWATTSGGKGKKITDVTQHMEITDDKGTSKVSKAGKDSGARTP